jgi:hypothetical protein
MPSASNFVVCRTWRKYCFEKNKNRNYRDLNREDIRVHLHFASFKYKLKTISIDQEGIHFNFIMFSKVSNED